MRALLLLSLLCLSWAAIGCNGGGQPAVTPEEQKMSEDEYSRMTEEMMKKQQAEQGKQ